MFRLFQTIGVRETMKTEMPALMVALVVAELFYKFHSFTLECLAFLGTWIVISSLLHRMSRILQGESQSERLRGRNP